MKKVKNLFSVTGRKFLQSLILSHIDQRLLEDHLELLESLEEHIKRTEAWIEKELKDNVPIGILSTLPGFGKVLLCLGSLRD